MSVSAALRDVFNSRNNRKNARDPLYLAVANGTADDSDPIQDWLDHSKSNLMPEGFYRISRSMIVRSGQHVQGFGRGTKILKDSFDGPAFLSNDGEEVVIENMWIAGPGRTVTTDILGNPVSNKGIDLHVTSNEIFPGVTLRNVLITDMNDISAYFGTCSFVILDRVFSRQCGFNDFLFEGGDGHTLFGCSTRFSLKGLAFRTAAGFGPTSISIIGCYVEQAGIALQLHGAHSVYLSGGGLEAPIDFDNDHPGICLDIDGATTFDLRPMCRLDTIGAAVRGPIVRVTNGAQGQIPGIERHLHATSAWNPNPEMVVEAGCDVWLGQHNFTAGRIQHNGAVKTPAMDTMS